MLQRVWLSSRFYRRNGQKMRSLMALQKRQQKRLLVIATFVWLGLTREKKDAEKQVWPHWHRYKNQRTQLSYQLNLQRVPYPLSYSFLSISYSHYFNQT